jgi:hypothetical protein
MKLYLIFYLFRVKGKCENTIKNVLVVKVRKTMVHVV